jgi:regulator of sigma E protease
MCLQKITEKTSVDSHQECSQTQTDSSAGPKRPATGKNRLLQYGLAILVGAGLVFLLVKYNPLGVLFVVLGLGLLIFVHELGHFLVAKWCDVHVKAFSLGFGPALPGCSFQRGETTYKIAVFPLGGFVKMVGEGSGEDGNDDPRSFRNKSVWQRMAIISAGVTMNLLLGFGCFVFVYMTHGVKRAPSVVDALLVGSPAWEKGLRTGGVIKRIGKRGPDPDLDELVAEVVNSVKGEQLPFEFENFFPDREKRSTAIEPRRLGQDPKPVVGIITASDLKLLPRRVTKVRELPVQYESPAAKASPAFQFDDAIIATSDPDYPDDRDRLLPLPPDPRTPDDPEHLDYFEFQRRLKQLAGKEMTIRVRRESAGEPVDIRVPPGYHYSLGLRLQMGQIFLLRENSSAHPPDQDPLIQPGEVMTTVEMKDSQENTIGKILAHEIDPIRLPFQLEQWAAGHSGPKKVILTLRDSSRPVVLPWDESWFNQNELPWGLKWSMSIPELGIAYQVETTVVEVAKGSQAFEAGIQPGDVIRGIRLYAIGQQVADEPEPQKWTDLAADEGGYLFAASEKSEIKRMDLRVRRSNGRDAELPLTAKEDLTWPRPDRGIPLIPYQRTYKARSLSEAILMGLERTRTLVLDTYGSMRSLITRRISTEFIGGPLSVARAAYTVADEDFFQFIILLGIISISLAVFNFLPVPILDGGHMVFLIYEKLSNRPASDRVRFATTCVGLALIAGLMLFVFYQDILKIL